jgi:Flp pilus assembly pilin Flp
MIALVANLWLMGALQELRRLLFDQRGQAMVEYSTLTFAILGILAATGFAVPINGLTLVERLYAAMQVYVDSMFYSLSLAPT